MTPDVTLIANAQMLAGAHIHAVAQKLIVYELGCELLEVEVMPSDKRDRMCAEVKEAETWLRQFVARAHASR